MVTLRKHAAIAALAALCMLVGTAPAASAQGLSEPPAVTPKLVAPPADPPPRQHLRLWFAAPRRGAAGRRVELVLRRRSRNSEGRYATKLCVAPPAIGWACRELVLRDGVRRVERRVHVKAPGRWLFEVRNGKQKLRRATRVAPRGKLSVLVTGDSMAQIFDHYMADGLGGSAAVRSEAHISTGLSKPSMLDWVANARSQARRVRPDVSVVFIGANDGFPMPTPSGATAPCCDSSWIEEYARRAAQMMRSYRRGGAGRVYWLTLPAPRGGSFRTVFGPVNAAIRRAARGVPGAHVVPIDRIFTPGFVYRDSLMWGGRNVSVRQADGVHLNNAGASIAAQKTIRRLRANRIL
ncbi:MAG TPA: GDSL-type esterase/lipase family protein [Thermoleophilaceae bacterium]|nr:GDSL-type esterase/lipase family protein [Thermoleophilaceae bacterium]